MSYTIEQLPHHERPRERLIRFGPSGLADRELLAMVLRNGWHQCNAIDLASSVTSALGSLQRIASAHVDDLRAIDGMGVAKSAAVVAAFELGRRATTARTSPFLSSSNDIANVAVPLLTGLTHERLVLLVADHALRLQRTIILSEGATAWTVVSTRDVLHAVLRSDGSAFALAHNHPTGVLTPSYEDSRATHAIAAAAQVVGLRFLDHIIIGEREWVSIE